MIVSTCFLAAWMSPISTGRAATFPSRPIKPKYLIRASVIMPYLTRGSIGTCSLRVADARPDWQLILLGPIVKIDPAALPQRPNIHYLGMKPYDQLPAYLSGWDAAFMPFALNAATRFISPTKTPEYLAAGKRVVSTPIADVVRTYGRRGLVRIAATPVEFVAAIEATLVDGGNYDAWLRAADGLLETMSWDQTWADMRKLMA